MTCKKCRRGKVFVGIATSFHVSEGEYGINEVTPMKVLRTPIAMCNVCTSIEHATGYKVSSNGKLVTVNDVK